MYKVNALCLRILSICLFFMSFNAFSICEDAEYRQFDFWLGKWNVTTPAGKVAGTNVITQSLNQCVLHEHYTTPSGFEGNSYNIFDKQTNQWHQTWVDNSGTLLKLDGGLVNGAMVLSGPGKMQDGTEVVHKISWSVNDDKTVRQHWEMSKDDGLSWSTLFDGTYTKEAQ